MKPPRCLCSPSCEKVPSRNLPITGGTLPQGQVAPIGLRAAPRPAAVLLAGLMVRWAFPRASRVVPRPEVVPPLEDHLPHLEEQVVPPPGGTASTSSSGTSGRGGFPASTTRHSKSGSR